MKIILDRLITPCQFIAPLTPSPHSPFLSSSLSLPALYHSPSLTSYFPSLTPLPFPFPLTSLPTIPPPSPPIPLPSLTPSHFLPSHSLPSLSPPTHSPSLLFPSLSLPSFPLYALDYCSRAKVIDSTGNPLLQQPGKLAHMQTLPPSEQTINKSCMHLFICSYLCITESFSAMFH